MYRIICQKVYHDIVFYSYYNTTIAVAYLKEICLVNLLMYESMNKRSRATMDCFCYYTKRSLAYQKKKLQLYSALDCDFLLIYGNQINDEIYNIYLNWPCSSPAARISRHYSKSGLLLLFSARHNLGFTLAWEIR